MPKFINCICGNPRFYENGFVNVYQVQGSVDQEFGHVWETRRSAIDVVLTCDIILYRIRVKWKGLNR